jgi:hypothetical protein
VIISHLIFFQEEKEAWDSASKPMYTTNFMGNKMRIWMWMETKKTMMRATWTIRCAALLSLLQAKNGKKILFMLLLLVSVGFGLLGKAFSFWQL